MKNTQINLIAFCEYALLDRDNKLSVIGIFNQVTVNKFPGGLPRAFFVVSVSTEPNSKWMFSIEGKVKGKVVFPAVNADVIVGTSGNHNWLVDLKGFVFPEEGSYEFSLTQNNKEIGTTTLTVMEAKNGRLSN